MYDIQLRNTTKSEDESSLLSLKKCASDQGKASAEIQKWEPTWFSTRNG